MARLWAQSLSNDLRKSANSESTLVVVCTATAFLGRSNLAFLQAAQKQELRGRVARSMIMTSTEPELSGSLISQIILVV